MRIPEAGQRWVRHRLESVYIIITKVEDESVYYTYFHTGYKGLEERRTHIKDLKVIFRLDEEYEWYRDILGIV